MVSLINFSEVSLVKNLFYGEFEEFFKKILSIQVNLKRYLKCRQRSLSFVVLSIPKFPLSAPNDKLCNFLKQGQMKFIKKKGKFSNAQKQKSFTFQKRKKKKEKIYEAIFHMLMKMSHFSSKCGDICSSPTFAFLFALFLCSLAMFYCRITI